MGKLKIGVIGTGTMGSLHTEVFSGLPDSEVVAVSDINESRAKSLCENLGINPEVYTDYQKMLTKSNLDAVAIAIPDSMHREPVISALEAGNHVLVEKPLAIKLQDCDDMLETARKYNKTLTVNYTHRWASKYSEGKAILDSGKVGQPVMAYARINDTIGVVEKWEWLAKSTPPAFLSSHDIDIIRWYMGCEAKSVYAKAYAKVLKGKGYNTLDAVQALVEFENDAMATFESGWIYPDTFPTLAESYMEVVAEKGVIHFDKKSDFEYANPDKYSYPKLSIRCRINGKLEGAFKLSLENYVKSLKEGKQPVTSGEEARCVAEIVDGIHRSIESGQPVKLSGK